MDTNPYAHQTAQDEYFEPARTSIAAVLGFVSSLIGCCLPIGIIGVLLGILGLVGIKRSHGRVGGKGLAIAAIIIGLLTTMLWIGGAIGMVGAGRFVMTSTVDPTIQVLLDAQSGDYDSARAGMTGSGANAPDEQWAAFVAAYTAEAGAFVSGPAGIGELVSGWALFSQMQSQAGQPVPNQQGLIPFKGAFANGDAMVFIVSNPNQQGPPTGYDLMIMTLDGAVITLSDYANAALPEKLEDETPEEPAAP